MVKRFAQLSLAVFLVLALATVASAGYNVPNTTQKGSLLVFPLVQLNGAGLDTYFFIGNDDKNEVAVKCYWMDENQSVKDFMFTITANQPVVFSASYNPKGNNFKDPAKGSLICFASTVDDSGPVIHNHLYGYAALTGGNAAYVYYNAYSFRVNGGGADMVTALGDTSLQLNLAGDTAFDFCHKYLTTVFAAYDDGIEASAANPWAQPFAPDLTLWPCKQDLRQDREPTITKAKFDIWRWNETKLTGSYQCFKCFFEGFLHAIGNPTSPYWGSYIYKTAVSPTQKGYGGPGANGTNFLASVLGYQDGDTDLPAVARMRITGVKSDKVCGTTTVKTGLVGVLTYANVGPAAPFILPEAAHTLHGAGWTAGDPGWVKIDVDSTGPVPEAPGQ